MSKQSVPQHHHNSSHGLKKLLQQDINFSSSSQFPQSQENNTTCKKDKPKLDSKKITFQSSDHPTPKKRKCLTQTIDLQDASNPQNANNTVLQIQNLKSPLKNKELQEQKQLLPICNEKDLTLSKPFEYSTGDFLCKQQSQNPENESLPLQQIICSYIHHNLKEKNRTAKHLLSRIKLIDKEAFDTQQSFWSQATYKRALKYICMILLSILWGVEEEKLIKEEIQVKMELAQENVRKQLENRKKMKELFPSQFNQDSQGSNYQIPNPNIYQQNKKAQQIKLTDCNQYIANQFLYYFINGSSIDNLLTFNKKIRKRILGKQLKYKLRNIKFGNIGEIQQLHQFINRNYKKSTQQRISNNQQLQMGLEDDLIMDAHQKQQEVYQILNFRSISFINAPYNITLNSECHCHISRQMIIKQIQVVRCNRCLRAYHLFCQSQLLVCSKCYQWQLSLKTYPIEQLVSFYVFCKKQSWYNLAQELKFSSSQTTSKIYDSKIYSMCFIIENYSKERSSGKFNKEIEIRIHQIIQITQEKQKQRLQKLQQLNSQLKSEVGIWTSQILTKIQKERIKDHKQTDLQQFYKYYSIYVNNRLIKPKRIGETILKIPCYLLQQKNIILVRRTSLKPQKKKSNPKETRVKQQIIYPQKSIFIIGVYKTQKISKPKPVRLTQSQYKNIIRMHPLFQQNKQHNWIVQSLQCPASQMMQKKPIKLPVRGYNCKHFQCFDLDVFLKNVYSKKLSRKQINQEAKKTDQKPEKNFKNIFKYKLNKSTIKQQKWAEKVICIEQKSINFEQLQNNEAVEDANQDRNQQTRFKREYINSSPTHKNMKLQQSYSYTYKKLTIQERRAFTNKQMRRAKENKKKIEMLNNMYHQKSNKCPVCHKILGTLLIDPLFENILKKVEQQKQINPSFIPPKQFYFNQARKYYFDKNTLLRQEQMAQFPINSRKNQRAQKKSVYIIEESQEEDQKQSYQEISSNSPLSQYSDSQQQLQQNLIELNESSSQNQ